MNARLNTLAPAWGALLLLGGPALAAEAPRLALSGNLQIHGERLVTTRAQHPSNLDVFWGRLNVGLDFKDERLSSKVLARVYPEGFGFEPVTKVNYDTTGQGKVQTQSEAQSKFLLPQAWARYAMESFAFRVGRMELFDAPSVSYGSYLDGGVGGRFYSRYPATDYNALEFTGQGKGFSSSVLLAATHKALNTGLLRLEERYTHASGFSLQAGYRVNAFDLWQSPDADLLHRYALSLRQAVGRFLLFAEGASLEQAGKANEYPLLLGVQMPVGKRLDLLSLEAEYLADRKVAGEDKPVFVNLHARKKFWSRLTLEANLHSDTVRSDFFALALGLRLTSALQ